MVNYIEEELVYSPRSAMSVTREPQKALDLHVYRFLFTHVSFLLVLILTVKSKPLHSFLLFPPPPPPQYLSGRNVFMLSSDPVALPLILECG